MARAPEYDPNSIAPGPDPGVLIDRPVITGVDDFDGVGPVAKWDTVPQFEFADKLSALLVLEMLGEEVKDLRHQLAHTLRYVKLAAQAASAADVMSKNKIVAHTGLAKQTVLDMLKDDQR